MTTTPPPRDAAHTPQPVDMSQESVAGEEDPGAGINVPANPEAAPSSSSAVRPEPQGQAGPSSDPAAPDQGRVRGGPG